MAVPAGTPASTPGCRTKQRIRESPRGPAACPLPTSVRLGAEFGPGGAARAALISATSSPLDPRGSGTFPSQRRNRSEEPGLAQPFKLNLYPLRKYHRQIKNISLLNQLNCFLSA